jgi:hypothetical protein
MKRVQQFASSLMLLSGVTHTAHFLFWDASPTNTAFAAAFGVCYFVIGVLLVRPWPIGHWLGAIVPAIGGVLGGLVALGNPDPLPIFHAVINWLVFPCCIHLLFQSAGNSSEAA